MYDGIFNVTPSQWFFAKQNKYNGLYSFRVITKMIIDITLSHIFFNDNMYYMEQYNYHDENYLSPAIIVIETFDDDNNKIWALLLPKTICCYKCYVITDNCTMKELAILNNKRTSHGFKYFYYRGLDSRFHFIHSKKY